MNIRHLCSDRRRLPVNIGLAALFAIVAARADAAVSFLGVAAGDPSSTSVTVWTRAVPTTELTLEITTDPTFTKRITQLTDACVTGPSTDFTCKRTVASLKSETVYYYRFVAS